MTKEFFKAGVPQSRVTLRHVDGVTDIAEEALHIRTIPVVFGVPMDEICYSKFWIIFHKHVPIMPWDAWATTESTYLPDARNQIHNGYLREFTLPFLFMLDSDIIVPPGILDRLLSHNLPIVGGYYRNKHVKMPPHPIVYDFISEEENGKTHWKHREEAGEGLERVDGMGAGCWLMRRDVAEALGESPYDMSSGTEDMLLSRKLMKLGISLHVDWSLDCAHLGVNWT